MMDRYLRGLASMFCIFFDKKTGSGVNVSEMLPKELYKSSIKKFKRKVYFRFIKNNIWAVDLAEIGSLSS